MPRLSLLAFVAWSSIAAGGCAAIAGLDQLKKDDCAGGCDDAKSDRSLDSSDDQTGDDSPVDQATTDSAADSVNETAADTGKDTGVDTGLDTGKDTGVDAGNDTSSLDAHDAADGFDGSAFDSGCGPLDSVSHCSACNVACAAASTSVASASCNGATCSYTCNAQYLNCNKTAPDTVGCECHTPGQNNASCCGSQCPVAHDNGLGQVNSTFYDCVSSGSYTAQLALDACASYTGNIALCHSNFLCNGPDGGPNGDQIACSDGALGMPCVCWTYAGPDIGTVVNGGQNPPNCFCGQGTPYH